MTEPIGATVARLANLVEGPAAFFSVIALGEPAIPALTELLRGPPTTVHQPRTLAADAIAQIGGPRAADALLAALTDCVGRSLDPVLRASEDVVASRVAEQLGVFDEPRVREALLAVLRDHAYPGCIHALARLREPRAAPLFARCLANDTTRAIAAESLCALGAPAIPDATRVVCAPVCVEGLEPPSRVDARVAAVSVLAAVGGDASDLPLAWALSDPQPAIRRSAAVALAHRGSYAYQVAAPILIEGLASDSWVEREESTNALRALGATVLGMLANAVRELPRDGAVAVIRLLAGAGDIEPIARLSTHRDPHVRWAAVDALGKLHTPAARAALAAYAHDPERAIRERAQRCEETR